VRKCYKIILLYGRGHLENSKRSVSLHHWLAAGSRCAIPTCSGLSVGAALELAAIIPAAAARTDRPFITAIFWTISAGREFPPPPRGKVAVLLAYSLLVCKSAYNKISTQGLLQNSHDSIFEFCRIQINISIHCVLYLM